MRTRWGIELIMPRMAGVSSSLRVRCSLSRPRPRSVWVWMAGRRLALAICSTVMVFLAMSLRSLGIRSGRQRSRLGNSLAGNRAVTAARDDLAHLLVAASSDATRVLLMLQGIEGRADDVVGIGRAERFGNNVVHAQHLEHGAHGAASDDAGTGGSRAKHHLAGAVTAFAVMVQRARIAQRHAQERALGRFR